MLYDDPSNPKLGWNDEELKERLEESNWHVRSWQLQNFETPTRISLEHWIHGSVKEELLQAMENAFNRISVLKTECDSSSSSQPGRKPGGAMEKLLAVFLHFQIIQVNRNGFEELLLTFDPSQEQMLEVSRFQKLKILKDS